MSEPKLVDCPQCEEAELVKKISAVSFRLKGGGWYETDFKNGNKKQLHDDGKKEAGSESDSKSSDSSESSSKTDGKESSSTSEAKSKKTETAAPSSSTN